ncbi:MAG: hypothetical protein Q4A71_07535 [Actinomycetaceae bacterium]|nr:hypothetical protein [Actinomycetaceae bacterium]
MRIYIPAVPADLVKRCPPLTRAVAATNQFQRDHHIEQWTEEDYESLAMDVAAGMSATLGAGARVVLAADADIKEEGSGIVTYQALDWSDVVSIHADGVEGRGLIAAADFESLEVEPLEWYDISERDYLAKLLCADANPHP